MPYFGIWATGIPARRVTTAFNPPEARPAGGRLTAPPHLMWWLASPAVVASLVGTGALPTAAAGWCMQCQREHRLTRTPEAERHARLLLASIDAAGRFDFEAATGEDRFRTEACIGGKMLGVLTCEGGTVLRAFSGMIGGSWHCPGWVGPVAMLTLEDETASLRFKKIVEHVRLAKASGEPMRTEHRRTHRALSAELTADLAASVVLRNWRGDEVGLPALLVRRRQQLSISRRPPWGSMANVPWLAAAGAAIIHPLVLGAPPACSGMPSALAA